MPNKDFLFPLATSGPLLFQTLVLAFSSTQMARLRGMKDTVQSLLEKQRAIEMLRQRMEYFRKGRRDNDDEMITAILAVASTEVRSRHRNPETSP
jgi:hypothetical protein